MTARPRRQRRRSLRARPGEIIAYYGHYGPELEGPDLCAAWGGEGAAKGDSNLLLEAFGAKIYGSVPLWKELETRGYDLRTLKFSIRKKVQQPADEPA